MKKVGQSDVGPDGRAEAWPRPVYDRAWVDAAGVAWRMRGDQLDGKRPARVLKVGGVAVAHAYGLEVQHVEGPARAALLGRVEAFLDGEAPAYSRFELGDFVSESRARLLMIQESC